MVKIAASSDTLKCIRRAFLLSTYTTLQPFQWHPSQTFPRGIATTWQLVAWSFHFIMMLGHVIHLFLRSWIAYHNDAMLEWKKFYCYFITIHMSLSLWIYVASQLNRERLPNFIERYVKFFQSQLPADTRNGFLTKNEMSFLRGLSYAQYANGLLIGLLGLVAPGTPDLWAAWFLKPHESVTYLDVLPWTPIQVYYGLSYANCAVGYTCCTFGFLFPTLNMLKCMQLFSASNNTGWKNLAVLRRCYSLEDKRLLKLYRQVQILVEEYNTVVGLFLFATKFTCIASAVFCTYGAVRLEGTVSGGMGLMGIIVMIFFAALMVSLGEVNNGSKLFLRRIRQRSYGSRRRCGERLTLDLWLEKSLKSTQELKIRVGSSYFIDKGIALTTFNITLESTINFLLASN